MGKAVEIQSRATDLMLAGSRAATMLRWLLSHGDIPAHHVSHVGEIVDGHKTAVAEWEKAIGITEVAHG